jgi:RNA polymerase sigma-70 factor (ECF subfamily)
MLLTELHCHPERGGIADRGGSASRSSAQRDSDPLHSSREDSALLKRILAGDSQAMTSLFDKYSKLVYAISLRILRDPAGAEDVLQEVFIRIWRFPEQIKRDRSLAPYLAVISRNRSIDILRQRRPSESIENLTIASPHDFALHAEQALMCEKARKLIDECPTEQRKVLEMAYFKGMPLSEIAEKTMTPLGTIKTRMRIALAHLRGGLPSTRPPTPGRL